MSPSLRRAGFSLLELLAALVIVGILVGAAAPSFGSYADGIRRRGALDRVSSDFYRARVLAVRTGEPMEIHFLPERSACVTTYALVRSGDGAELARVQLREEARGLCLLVRGGHTVRIDRRGLPAGAARTLIAQLGGRSDSLKISLVGRVYRFY